MGGCCYSCLKYMVMIFNLIYMLLGLALQGTMLWIYFDETVFVPVAKEVDGYNVVIFILMGIGLVMTVMGFLGCCGALQESQCMLATFFALVLVLFAGQVAACTWIFLNTEKFKDITIKSIKDSFQSDYGFEELKTKAMDTMQRELMCCGASGPGDWANARINNPDNDRSSFDIGVSSLAGLYTIPRSCCHRDLPQDTCDKVRQVTVVGAITNNIYTDGCADKVIVLIKENIWLAVGVVLAIALIEVLAMIFSIVLCCTARRIDQYKA